MKEFGISGVWKTSNGEIIHYAVHEQSQSGFTTAKRMTKDQAIRVVKNPHNKVYTWVWNYQLALFQKKEIVAVVNGKKGEYLRSNPDNTVTDNLGHLIDASWFY